MLFSMGAFFLALTQLAQLCLAKTNKDTDIKFYKVILFVLKLSSKKKFFEIALQGGRGVQRGQKVFYVHIIFLLISQ